MPLHLKLRLFFSFRVKLILAFLAVIIIAVVISINDNRDNSPEFSSGELILSTTKNSLNETTNALTTKKDEEYDTYIILSDDKTTINGEGATFSQGKVTISESGTYAIKGTLSDGSIEICNDAFVKIMLMGVSVNCENGAALKGDGITEKSVIHSAEGTSNIFSGGTKNEAAICSDGQLNFSGKGRLVIRSEKGVAVEGEDEIYIEDADMHIISKSDGIVGGSGMRMADSEISVVSASDGIKTAHLYGPLAGDFEICNSRVDVYSAYDGISSAGNLSIEGGKLEISTSGIAKSEQFRPVPEGNFSGDKEGAMVFLSGGDEDELSGSENNGSAKGLKAQGDITVKDAGVKISSHDDAISASDITIESGYISVDTDKNGMFAEEQIKINGGDIDITKSLNGIESATVSLNGGTIIIKASDDGINASAEEDGESCLVEFDGAYVQIDSAGDGIESDGDIVVLDGTLVVFGPENAENSAFDCEEKFHIVSGTVLALSDKRGASEISTDGLSVLSHSFNRKVSGTGAILKTDGESVIGYHSPKSYDYVVLVSQNVAANENCEIYVGGSFDQNSVDGIYFGKYNKGTFAGKMK